MKKLSIIILTIFVFFISDSTQVNVKMVVTGQNENIMVLKDSTFVYIKILTPINQSEFDKLIRIIDLQINYFKIFK